MKTSPLHVGMVIDEEYEPGYAIVWIPTGKSYVPPGFSEYKYENSGGQLHGSNLDLAKGTSYKCKISSPLTSGSWWKSNPARGASVFDDYSDEPLAYPLYPKAQSTKSSAIHGYRLPTDNPRVSGAVATTTLSVAGGNPTHTVGTLPKGQFMKIRENQWVVVGFLFVGSDPIILNSIHSDEAWKAILTR